MGRNQLMCLSETESDFESNKTGWSESRKPAGRASKIAEGPFLADAKFGERGERLVPAIKRPW
jgi:hypothetical protein